MRIEHKPGFPVSFLIILLLLAASGCNWVDSTGRQGNNTPTTDLSDGDVIAELEESSREVNATAEDDDGIVESWAWSGALDEGALQECVNHLDLAIAGDSLSAVCEDADNCEILFLEDESQAGVFTVLTPKITAPVGVTHNLAVTDNDGGVVELAIHFCLDSVNEAPLAGEDSYTVVEGSILQIGGSDANSLLVNDSDDRDVRNQSLTILGVVDGKGPQYADSFTLGEDGGFSYSISPFTPFTVTEDSFSYRLSDGSNVTEGSVVLDLSVINDPPVVTGFIADQNATIGIAFGPLDVSNRFSDPERAQLDYSATGLPQGIAISTTGVISGTAGISNNVGQYPVVVSASDGQSSVSLDPFTINLAENEPPQLNSQIDDQLATVGVAYSVSVAGHFSDPENQPLSYSASGLPASFSISSAGVIGGTALDSEVGQYSVTVVASDSINETLMTFTFEVQPNQPPVQLTGIPRQFANIGAEFSLDVAQYFEDPEGDAISYSATGLPASGSLSISPEGLISGIPLEEDRTGFTFGIDVTVIATDSKNNVTNAVFTLSIF